jgi:hypothetical protein
MLSSSASPVGTGNLRDPDVNQSPTHCRAPALRSVIATLALTASSMLRAQTVVRAQPTAPAPDATIAAALRQISPDRIQADIDKLVSFGTRSTISAQDAASIGAGQGIGAAREWIKSQFMDYSRQCGNCLEVMTDSYLQEPAERVPKPTVITDVYAMLRGTDPEAARRIVLVTGHYDSRVSDVLDSTSAAPGANDDASGTAVSLECARVLSTLKFPATIVFLTVAGEEQGLYGSRHFAQMAKQQGWNIVAALNDDIVGGDKGPGQNPQVVRVFSEGLPTSASKAQIKQLRALGAESDSPSRELARYIAEAAADYDTGVQPLPVFRLDRFLRAGDHYSFNEQGYTAVRFTEYREDFDHQHQTLRTKDGIEYGDLSKFVDFGYVANVARVNALTLALLASAPAAPDNVRVSTSTLDNDSTLKWQPSAAAASYEVVWRDTSSPVWQRTKNVGNVTSATLDVSKDNVIFAVRAIDAAGHRSLPVIPLPER